MRPLWHLFIVFVVSADQSLAQQDNPLSAIDWLSESVVEDAAVVTSAINEPPTTTDATAPPVSVTTLDGPSPDPVGLLSTDVTGLPRTLWSQSDEATLIALLKADGTPQLPAIREFLTVLILAKAEPPNGASSNGGLFLARVDKLLDLGNLDQAQALLEQSNPETPDLFRRFFDVTLLTGTEDDACAIMETKPSVAPTYPARVFCLARSGDWAAAALTLNTHRALGDISDEEELLLSLFLDPEVAELQVTIPAPARVSPLVFRMREAIGESLSTTDLPLAFAHADLRSTTGWKAQLEAAERLARQGALDANTLQALYTSRTPSASGGVWDRVDAFQEFDSAIARSDASAVADTLPDAWAAMKAIKAEVPFASLYANRLSRLSFDGDTAALAFEINLMSASYETLPFEANGDPFLAALARGVPQEVRATSEKRIAVQAAFNGAPVPAALKALANDAKLGEALLRTIAISNAGNDGDLQAMTDALATLRSVGLEDVARRAALQFVVLERQ